jgi:hypothetical protein
MTHQLTLSGEELGELDEMLSRELQAAHVELHRTDSLYFKEKVQHHLELMTHVREAVRTAEASPVPDHEFDDMAVG